MTEVKRVFTVDGKPFFPVGGQSCNSSGYSADEAETAFKAIKALHGNTLEIPVYWEQVEPIEGKFDFSSVNALIAGARRYGLKLILLWFATWKNGNMDYAPQWVKTNPERFKRVISRTGSDIWNLSSHCEANLEADIKAFTALCKHLKDNDSADQTVISIQIENEPGIIGSDRDYGPDGQAIFDSPVPQKMLTAMQKKGTGAVYRIWQKAGRRACGNWVEVFGREAPELMTAWSIASYINAIAKAGKQFFPCPMYINVWMMEQNWWSLPGESYPSGGAVTKVLDIYKWFTPDIDIIAPDNYAGDSRSYESNCANYAREDNPLFMPESEGDLNIFRAVAEYNTLGSFFMGAEDILDKEGGIRPDFQALADNSHILVSSIPLLLKYQGTGKIHAVIQEYRLSVQRLSFEASMGLVEFGDAGTRWIGKDWRHNSTWLRREQPNIDRARGLIIEAGKNELYLAGINFRLYLRPNPFAGKDQVFHLVAESSTRSFGYIVSVDEGHFDQNGIFVADRRRNGDEIGRRGVWVQPDVGVVRVITCE